MLLQELSVLAKIIKQIVQPDPWIKPNVLQTRRFSFVIGCGMSSVSSHKK